MTHYPETILPRTGHITPADYNFANTRRLLDFMAFESCLDAPEVLPLGGSYIIFSRTQPMFSTEYSFVGRERA